MLIWLIFGVGYPFVVEAPNRRIVSGSYALLFVLIALLGWGVLGSAVK